VTLDHHIHNIIKPSTLSLFFLALVLTTFLAHSSALFNGFVSLDDGHYVLANPIWPLEGPEFWRALFFSNQEGNWIPLSMATHLADLWLFAYEPLGHHAHSILWHLACSLLLFRLFSLWFRRIELAWLAACLWAIHPLGVESVAWISERKNLVSTFFFLAALLAWHSFKTYGKWRHYAIALLLFAAGLAAKAMLVTLPCLLLLLELGPYRTGSSMREDFLSLRRLLPKAAPFFLFSLAISLMTLYFQHDVGSVASVEVAPFSLRVLNALRSYGVYLGQFLLPTHLAIHYPLRRDLTIVQVLPYLAILIAWAAVCLWSWRSNRWPLIGLLWFFGSLVPVIGLIQVGGQAHADRYAYLPMIGLLPILSLVPAEKIFTRAYRGIMVAFLLGISYLTGMQARTWKNSTTMWKNAVEKVPRHDLATLALADEDLVKGRLEEAMAKAELISQWQPSGTLGPVLKARVLRFQGKRDQARKLAEDLYGEFPNDRNVIYEFIWLNYEEEKFQEAAMLAERLLELDNDTMDVLRIAARINNKLGLFEEAARLYDKILKKEPKAADFQEIAEFYLELGQEEKAKIYIGMLSEKLEMSKGRFY
jgi:tetratricopeptide (TPR) repeat protein